MPSTTPENWKDFWDGRAGRDGDFEATARGSTDIVGFLHVIGDVFLHLKPAAKDDVLDVGCGTGLMVLAMAPLVQHVHGVDFSRQMVARARRNLENVDNVSFSSGMIGDIEQEDASFDKVLVYSVIQYLRDRDEAFRAFSEVARVLRPRGRAFIAANPDPASYDARRAQIEKNPNPEARQLDLNLLDQILWLDPDEALNMAGQLGLQGSVAPVNPRVPQHLYMYDLVVTKHG